MSTTSIGCTTEINLICMCKVNNRQEEGESKNNGCIKRPDEWTPVRSCGTVREDQIFLGSGLIKVCFQ